ncbi:hypothetical protein FPANT_6054 [Fusarium pseudoanthophilum]|uniref:Uncharacterized protein n=1 Tax=Fusarium pseudoanthophilum TaxID=48495 RepID=A0A8H5LCD7_9HYPO|nr:hypothetical protein FPANT_6054 [Fusarium pseudoanthophilum]
MSFFFGSNSNWMSNEDTLWKMLDEPSHNPDLYRLTTADRSSLVSRDLAIDSMFRPRETYQESISRRASEWAHKTAEWETRMAVDNLLNNSLSSRLANVSGTGNHFIAQSAPSRQTKATQSAQNWQAMATESVRSSTKKEEPYKFRFDLHPGQMEFDKSEVLSRFTFNTGMNLVLPGSDSKYKWYATVKHGWLNERSADTLFSCTSENYQIGYKTGRFEKFKKFKKFDEKFECDFRVGSENTPRRSVQFGGVGFEHVSGTKFELDVFRIHNHPRGEDSPGCAACTVEKLNLDGIGASIKHKWSSDAETKFGVFYDMENGGFSPFGEHKQNFNLGKGGSLGVGVRCPPRGSRIEATVSWVWNKLTGF